MKNKTQIEEDLQHEKDQLVISMKEQLMQLESSTEDLYRDMN